MQYFKTIATTFFFALSLLSPSFAASPPKIYILQIVEHPALDATRDGLIEELKNLNNAEGESLLISIQSAQGNPALAAQIARKFVSEEPDIIVALGTPAAQAAMSAAKGTTIKIIFSSVTDPILAKLVANLNKPEGNVTGVSNFISVKPQFDLFKRLTPGLKTLGVIYNPGEANSVALNREMEKIGKAMGIKLIFAAALKTSDVQAASQTLCGKIDALFVNNDNTALSAFKSVVKAANNCSIPAFVSDVDIVDQGARAALGPDQSELGRQTARMINRILKNPGKSLPPVEFPEKTVEVLGSP